VVVPPETCGTAEPAHPLRSLAEKLEILRYQRAILAYSADGAFPNASKTLVSAFDGSYLLINKK